jgi:diazepam-binding inhibitor (GABA receptor modulating acyl-CoA-binding protein)
MVMFVGGNLRTIASLANALCIGLATTAVTAMGMQVCADGNAPPHAGRPCPATLLRLRGAAGEVGIADSGADAHLKREFIAAAEYARQMPGVATEDKLVLYGLYKQATVGQCDAPQPSRFAWADKAKWQRWHALKGMNPSVAARVYIKHLDSMQPLWRSSRPPQFQDLGLPAEDSSQHLSSLSEAADHASTAPPQHRHQETMTSDSSGDSKWDEDSEGTRTPPNQAAQRGQRGDMLRALASSRVEQRMRLQAPTAPPVAPGIPELGIRPIHEEHADQMRFARLMDLLVLQRQVAGTPEASYADVADVCADAC